MKHVVYTLEARKHAMLSEYPVQQELTKILFGEIAELFQEDFETISRKSKRVKLIFDCAICVLKKCKEQNVKKKYATDLLDVFLEKDVVSYINKILGENAGDCIFVIKAARSELYCSQWSDPTSKHWQRAINRFR